MVSYFKSACVVSTFLMSAVIAAPITDAAAHKEGVEAGLAVIDGMVLVAQKNYPDAKTFVDKVNRSRQFYSGSNHSRDYYQGILDGFKKHNLNAVFQKAGLDDKQKAFVMYVYNFIKANSERKLTKKSYEEARLEAFSKTVEELQLTKNSGQVEQMQQVVAEFEKEMITAFEALEENEIAEETEMLEDNETEYQS